MSLADDIRGGLHDAFAPAYAVGGLSRSGWQDDDKGKVTRDPASEPVLLQVDRLTRTQRDGDGFVRGMVRLIVLTINPSGQPVAPFDDDATITDENGKTYTLSMIELDAARSFWDMRGNPTSRT